MRIYINNRNYLTWTALTARHFSEQGHEVVLIDNASTYEPLVDWYATCGYVVCFLQSNLGHLAPWLAGIIDDSDHYAVTDPDLSYDGVPGDWEQVCLEGLRRGADIKVGFSLDETRIPPSNPAWVLDEFCQYPSGNHPDRWGDHLKLGQYMRYPIDTTFAVYRPRLPFAVGGWRICQPYTARHRPWHLVLDVDPHCDDLQIPVNDEIFYYFASASTSSVTKQRMMSMLTEYASRKGIVFP